MKRWPNDTRGGGEGSGADEGQPFRVVFERDAGSGRVEHLLVGFDRLRRRPRVGSLRFKAMAGLGAACVVFATAAWQGYERFSNAGGEEVEELIPKPGADERNQAQ